MHLVDKILFKAFKFEGTYSQTGEDKILKHLFNSRKKINISYLDIGTNHPLINNNTYLFYKNGGHGVCVEPNPALCEVIKKLRPRDTCLNVGISEENQTAEFYRMSSHNLSTFVKEEAVSLEKSGKYKIEEVLKINVKNINSIIKENFTEPLDLVSIDVEGWNEEIVRSFDFNQSRPFCFCIETITFSEDDTGEKLHGIFEILERNNYKVYADTHINTIFVNNDNNSDK